MTPPSLATPQDSAVSSGEVTRTRRSKSLAKIAAWTLVAVFCIYRLATFIPEPLDGPHTLRPILNRWFDAWLRLHAHPEAAYEDWRTLCLVALLIAPALAVLNLLREQGMLRLSDRARKFLCSRGLFFAAIAATLFLCRYPTLVDYQLNPDEGQFLAAAHKLFYNANFFDSVDCGTSGPLNIYPLMLPAIFGFSPDYASSRVLVLLISLGTIYLFYRTLRLLAPDSIARVAVLLLAGAIAVFEDPNLVHYSSEQVPVLLVALTLWVGVRVLQDPGRSRVRIFLLGFLVSTAFFAKMQSVPIVAAIGAVAVIYTYATGSVRRFWEPAALYIAGIVLPQLLNAAVCLATGTWANFWMSYIISNQRYADRGSNFVTELPALVSYLVSAPESGYFLFTFLAICASYAILRLRGDRTGETNALSRMAMASAIVTGALMAAFLHADAPTIAAYLVLIAAFMLLMFFLLSFKEGPFGADPLRWFGLLSTGAVCAAIFSIYRPHHMSPGYPLFLFLPVAAAVAWMLIRQTRDSVRLAFPLLCAALALIYSTFLWGTRDPHRFRTSVATIRQGEGDFIHSLTSPDGQIFVWGWTVDPYLGSGRVVSTRDLNLNYQFFAPEEITSFYRRRLLEDLSHNPPELIVDAIGTNSWAMEDNAIYGIAQVPEIARWVNDFYRHVADGYGERFYLRADLAARSASIALPKACAPTAVRCIASPRRFYGEGMTTPVMDNLPPANLPQHARVEVQFTPFGRQTENATILNNEAVPNSFRGIRFQNMGGDLYKLMVGVGDRWIASKPIYLQEGRPVWLSIDLAGQEVGIRTNGVTADTLHLPSPVADAPGPITIGSWINGACRFSGTIQFFQLINLT